MASPSTFRSGPTLDTLKEPEQVKRTRLNDIAIAVVKRNDLITAMRGAQMAPGKPVPNTQLRTINSILLNHAMFLRTMLEAFNKSLAGGIFTRRSIPKVLEKHKERGAQEVAYLQRFIAQFEELLQSIGPSLDEVIAYLKQTEPMEIYIVEDKLQNACRRILDIYADKYQESFAGLIRKEDPDLLRIPGVDSKFGGLFVIIRIFAATLAFNKAVDRVEAMA